MHHLATRFRRALTVPLALLIVAALQHCAWEGAQVVQHRAVIAEYSVSGETLPIGLPIPGCDNESGCICRGATLAHVVDLAAFQPVQIDLLLLDSNAPQPGLVVAEAAAGMGLFDDPSRLPPLTGRILRARLSSLVI